jgi:phosphatidylglycerophosphate synthase
MGDEFLPAHTQLLQEALRQAATRRGEGEVYAALSSPAATLTATALAATCILLVVLPPFVLTFEYDAHRPWRSSSRVVWFSVAISALLTLIVAVGLTST